MRTADRWGPPLDVSYSPSGDNSRVTVRVSRGAFVPRPERLYGPATVAAPVWPDSLKTLYRAVPRQSYTAEEQALSAANGWTVLRSGTPKSFGAVSFAEVLRVLQCPSVLVDATCECVALITYGSLLRGEPLTLLGDVVIDLLPWPEPAFLIRPVPMGQNSP